MRYDWRIIPVAALPLAIGTAVAAGVHRTHSRPQTYCALPEYGYVHGSQSLPALAVSHTAILLRQPVVSPANPAGQGERIALYQLNQARLQVGHCMISRAALTLRSDGAWVLSLRADQNPIVPVGPPAPSQDVVGTSAITRFTAHIKRNLFTIRVRGYGEFQIADPDPDSSPGRPVLFDLAPAPFWVERGVPEFKTFVTPINDPAAAAIAHNFDLIDRVEIELRYQ